MTGRFSSPTRPTGDWYTSPLAAITVVVAVLVWKTRLHLLWMLAAGAALEPLAGLMKPRRAQGGAVRGRPRHWASAAALAQGS